MIDPVVSVSLRCLLALLFAAAAWHKASDSPRFASTLEAYRVLPPRVGRTVASALPFTEATVAVLLLLPVYRWGAFGAVTLLVLYSVAIIVNLARGRREIDCGCFGPATNVPLSGGLIIRNAVLLIAATLVSLPVTARSLIWIDAFTLVTVVPVATLLWVSFWKMGEGSRIRRGRQ